MKAYVYYVESEEGRVNRTRVICENGEAYYQHDNDYSYIKKSCFALSFISSFRYFDHDTVKERADAFDKMCNFKSTLVATIEVE